MKNTKIKIQLQNEIYELTEKAITNWGGKTMIYVSHAEASSLVRQFAKKFFPQYVVKTSSQSFAGGNWNINVSKEEMDTFLSIVQPEKYKKQFELENEIISLAKRIDMIDQMKALMTTPVVEEVTEDVDVELDDYNYYMQELRQEEARRTTKRKRRTTTHQ